MSFFTGIDLKMVARDTLRMYFAPLNGAVKQVRLEQRRMDKENARRMDESAKRHA